MALAVYTKFQIEKARRLAELVPTLSRVQDKQTGIVYRTFPSSDDPTHTGHNATALHCSCDGWRKRAACSHQLAMVYFDQEQTARRIAEAQAKRRENGVCQQPGCILTATTKLGRCEAHSRVILSLVADL